MEGISPGPLSSERLLLLWVFEVTDLGILRSVLCSFSQDTWGLHLEILEASPKV